MRKKRRLEKERLEYERLENERLENERLEKIRLEYRIKIGGFNLTKEEYDLLLYLLDINH